MNSKFRFIFTGAFILFLFVAPFSFKKNIRIGAEPNCQDPSSVAIGDMDYCIQKLQGIADSLKPAQENNKKELANLNAQLTSLKNQITGISQKLTLIANEINQKQKDLEFTKAIFEEKVGDQYKFIRIYDPIMPFLSDNASGAFQEIILRQKVADNDRTAIENYVQEISNLNSD